MTYTILSQYSVMVAVLIASFCSCSKVVPPAGPIVAKVLAKDGIELHASMTPAMLIAKKYVTDHLEATIKFDGRTIVLDSPLRRLAIENGLSGFTGDVHLLGASLDVSQHIDSGAMYKPSPNPGSSDAYIKIGEWEQVFHEPIHAVTVTTDVKPAYRYNFVVDSATASLTFFPNRYGVANLHGSIDSFQNVQDDLIAGLMEAGYPRSDIEQCIAEIKSEYKGMSDRDFMLVGLSSNGPSLPKEANLKNALRYFYVQNDIDFEWAFTTYINEQEVFVFKQKPLSKRVEFPFRVCCSFVDAHGTETAWAVMSLPKKIEQQEVADRFATLLTDDQNK